MIKLFIDDKRKAPAGWHQVWDIEEAFVFIEENYLEISHVDFDYYLSDEFPQRNSMFLLNMIKGNGIDLFHQPIENYSFHSSDSVMNDVMKDYVLLHFYGVKKKEQKPSQLQMLRKFKGRR